MMWQYGNGMGGWGFGLMTVGNLLVWTLIAVVVIALLRHVKRSGPAGPRSTAEELLAERFARGDIDEQQYSDRLDVLRRSQAHSGG